MKNIERINIAKEIKDIIIKKYGKNKVYLFAILGSTVKKKDTKFSDLEMMCLFNGKFKEKDPQIFFKKRYMHVWMNSKIKTLKDIKNINFTWPFEVGTYFNIKIIYGDKIFLKEVKTIIKSIPEKNFKRVIEHNLHTLFEKLGKLQSIKIRKGLEIYDINSATHSILLHTVTDLALLNKKGLYGGVGMMCLMWLLK
ncbi:MAG: hypothetical protein ISS82_00820 [Nanoarchaeota archaeon]|nr:hypothetical protein [Nanoarchaeota archaeon]